MSYVILVYPEFYFWLLILIAVLQIVDLIIDIVTKTPRFKEVLEYV